MKMPVRGSRRKTAMAAAALAGASLFPITTTLQAAQLDSVRLRSGVPADAGDIDGGALGLTFEPESTPVWLGWIGDDMHYEAALSLWTNADPDNDNVYTTHFGPAWRFRPWPLGERGFLEAGTSIAYVSEQRVAGSDLGSLWHFTTHATLGYELGAERRWHLGLRVRHSSNAGFASPNPGLDIVMLELGYQL